MSLRSGFTAAARWVEPSAVRAASGALVAAVIDGLDRGSVAARLVGGGFVALLVVPWGLAVFCTLRALGAAWSPRRLGLVDERGTAPVLAAHLAAIALLALGLAQLVYGGTWWFSTASAFKVRGVALFEAALATGGALGCALVERPLAIGIGFATRRLARRWPRLVTVRAIGIAIAICALGAGVAAWFLVVRDALGTFDWTVIWAPAGAIAGAVLVPLALGRLRARRAIAGRAILCVAGAGILVAGLAVLVMPQTTLEIWGDRELAGFAVDRIFNLDRVHDRISPAAISPAPKPGASHPDIVLVTIDTVRADHTPLYGGSAHMPTLAALGARGAVFDWAFSAGNVTRRSIPAMITGLDADRVHGRVVAWALRVDPRHILLAERMRAAGYDTAGFMCCHGFWGARADTGLERGLDHLEIVENDGKKLAQRARAWLEERAQTPHDRPLFLWIHILEPHAWAPGGVMPARPQDRQRLYDGTLAACDGMLADVLAPFAARPSAPQPIVVVTADHGEALGDHGQPFHSTDVYDSQIHVPLVIAGPGIPAHRVAETVSGVDLLPTLLDLAGFAPPPGLDGRSIADLATGARISGSAGHAYTAMVKDRWNPGGKTAFVEGTWKIIDNDGKRIELYDLAVDPGEHRDLAPERPPQLAHLLELLRAKEAEASTSPFE